MSTEEAPDFTLPSAPTAPSIWPTSTVGRWCWPSTRPTGARCAATSSSLYQAILHEFDGYDAALAAVSVDGVWCHQAFAEARGLTFPLMSDFEPKGAVSRMYDAYRSQDGFSERALFVLDPEGRIEWREVVPPEENPGADGILRVLDDMTAHSVS